MARIDYSNLDHQDIRDTIAAMHQDRDGQARQVLGITDPRETKPHNYNIAGIAHQVAKAVNAADSTPVDLMSDAAYRAHVTTGQAALAQAIRDHYNSA